MTTKLFTKPTVAIRISTAGAAVILGRAESIPHANAIAPDRAEKLIAAVEAAFPQIQAYIDQRENESLISMSRAAERACGLTAGQMSEFIETQIMPSL